MANLQTLHDFYLSTKPNSGKVQHASNLLIRLCKQMNLDSPEDITPELYQNLPEMIDVYYRRDIHKAIQDKSMLAEMIGRYGPKEGWEVVLKILLNDRDSNLRQFSFQTLEYSAKENPELILPYIEKFKNDSDNLMISVAAKIMSKMCVFENRKMVNSLLDTCSSEGNYEFLELLRKNSLKLLKREEEFTQNDWYQSFFNGLTQLTETASLTKAVKNNR
jgi:hypothetical protein